jgi:hypothetical protein
MVQLDKDFQVVQVYDLILQTTMAIMVLAVAAVAAQDKRLATKDKVLLTQSLAALEQLQIF